MAVNILFWREAADGSNQVGALKSQFKALALAELDFVRLYMARDQ